MLVRRPRTSDNGFRRPEGPPKGLGAPKGTPSEIVGRLNKEINAGFADPTFTARLADFGGVPLTGSPADFGNLLADETKKWAKVIKFANIKIE
jgi:tripartite-type tricarboxylate transporter receptor subunit TctC